MEWATYTSMKPYPSQRYGHASICLGRNVIVIGGKGTSGANIEVWLLEFPRESSIPRWRLLDVEQTRQPIKKRWGFACCLIPNLQVVFMHGGFDSLCNYGDTNFLTARGQCGSGIQLESVPHALTWRTKLVNLTGRGPSPRAYHSAVYVAEMGGKVLVFGGQCCVGGPYDYYNDLYCLEPLTGLWSRMECSGTPPTPRSQHTAFIYDQHMYIYGGYAVHETFNDLYKFNLTTREWEQVETSGEKPQVVSDLTPQPFRVHSSRCPGMLHQHKFVILSEDKSLRKFLIYELSLKSLRWKKLEVRSGTEPDSRGNATMTLMGGRLCVLGGHSSKEPDDGFKRVLTATLPRPLSWNCEKLLWLARFKNYSNECPMAKLPPEIIQYIIQFVNSDVYEL